MPGRSQTRPVTLISHHSSLFIINIISCCCRPAYSIIILLSMIRDGRESPLQQTTTSPFISPLYRTQATVQKKLQVISEQTFRAVLSSPTYNYSGHRSGKGIPLHFKLLKEKTECYETAPLSPWLCFGGRPAWNQVLPPFEWHQQLAAEALSRNSREPLPRHNLQLLGDTSQPPPPQSISFLALRK